MNYDSQTGIVKEPETVDQQGDTKKNISIQEFCRRNRITKSLLYSWMSMDSVPSLENAYKLSVIFHCSVDDLIKGVKPDG